MLETPRLRLRQWRDSDVDPFAEMGRDAQVMACLPRLYTRDEAQAIFERNRDFIEERGYGFWALEEIGGAPFIGFVGIKDVLFDAPFTPAVEIGWRLARAYWGKGYASEAARAALAYGFEELGLDEIVAFLLAENQRSAHVCERLGMRRDPSGDFEHPKFSADTRSVAGYAQRPHILYRISRT